MIRLRGRTNALPQAAEDPRRVVDPGIRLHAPGAEGWADRRRKSGPPDPALDRLWIELYRHGLALSWRRKRTISRPRPRRRIPREGENRYQVAGLARREPRGHGPLSRRATAETCHVPDRLLPGPLAQWRHLGSGRSARRGGVSRPGCLRRTDRECRLLLPRDAGRFQTHRRRLSLDILPDSI